MLSPHDFHNLCTKHGIDFFTGVPDSLLKDFCAYITDHVRENQHVIAANDWRPDIILQHAGLALFTCRIPGRATLLIR